MRNKKLHNSPALVSDRLHDELQPDVALPPPHQRTDRIPKDIHVEPERFAAELISKLEGVLRQREAEEKLEERLKRVRLVGFRPNLFPAGVFFSFLPLPEQVQPAAAAATNHRCANLAQRERVYSSVFAAEVHIRGAVLCVNSGKKKILLRPCERGGGGGRQVLNRRVPQRSALTQ